jgi:hypothetical protein
MLENYQRRYGFQIRAVDIDADPELVERYNTVVPVVAVNGKVRFRGLVNEALLRRLLLAETRSASDSRTEREEV